MVILWSLSQLHSYSVLDWLLLVSVAFLSARLGGTPGIFIGHFLVAIIIIVLDVGWVQAEMQKPAWDGTPDFDIVFPYGVLCRVLLINTVLLPLSLFALRLGTSSRRRQAVMRR